MALIASEQYAVHAIQKKYNARAIALFSTALILAHVANGRSIFAAH